MKPVFIKVALLLMALMMVLGSSVAMNPYPVYGTTNPLLKVVLTIGDEEFTTISSPTGYYQFDLNDGYTGRVGQIQVQGCPKAEFTFTDGVGMTKDYPCNQPPMSPEGCPVSPVTPAAGTGAILGGLAALVAMMGGSLKAYVSKSGQVVFQHRHKGILGYHDPNVQHKDKRYRHTSFSKDPVKFAADMKKLAEEGQL